MSGKKDKVHRRRFLGAAGASTIALGVTASLPSYGDTIPETNGSPPRSMARVRDELIDYMQTVEVIDTHEHIRPEAWRLRFPMDAVALFQTYTMLDLDSSVDPSIPADNLRKGYPYLTDPNIPLEERWRTIAPHLEKIKHGAYYRATEIALRDIYGVEEVNDSNYKEVSEKVRAANKPGFYHEVLRNRCNIKTCLVQCSGTHLEELAPRDLLTPIYSGSTCYKHSLIGFIHQLTETYGTEIEDLPGYLEALGKYLKDQKDNGVAGFKTYASGAWTHVIADTEAANVTFSEMVNGEARTIFAKMMAGGPNNDNLEAAILDHVFKLAAEWDWPISMHCGGAYMDFRVFQTRKLLDVITRYPETRFDLFHLGIPFAREIIFIAKQFSNITLNMTWAPLLSDSLTRQSVNEIIDTVPISKVIAFGGDYREDIENVYGHLVLTRELIADALTERIARGRLDLEHAKHISKLWFYDNPTKIYRLG